MAAVPGAQPVLEIGERDRATLRWLQQQPSLFAPGSGGEPLQPPLRPQGQQEAEQLHDHHAGAEGRFRTAEPSTPATAPPLPRPAASST